MDAKKTAQQVLEQVGGAENVTFLTHCVTRLRFNLKSMDGVDEAKVKAVPGVVGVVNKGGQYQVIIGNEVAAVYDELMKLGDFGGKEVKQPAAPAEEKKSRVSIILDTLAGVFTPLMPLIAGAGMIKALLSVLTLFGWIDKSGNLYYFLNFIADSSYYFLPIFLANSAAKKFGCNPQMAMLLGAILLHPNFIALKADADVVHVLGLPVKMVTYSSSVIPIFLITLVLPYVERFVNKVVPSVVKFILRPVLTILIMAPISLCVLGPLGSIIGDGLVSVLLAIEKVCPWALPTVIGAFMPFLVMTGMHYSLLPAYVNSLSMLGYETVIGPGNLPSNIAQGAAALCVAIKTKNKNFRQLAVSGGVTALLGVTEPALFGVNVRLRKPLIATTIGGGLGGNIRSGDRLTGLIDELHAAGSILGLTGKAGVVLQTAGHLVQHGLQAMDLLLVQCAGQLGDALLIELVQAIVQPDRAIAELACAIVQGGHAVVQGLGASWAAPSFAEWAPSAAVATPLVYWLTLDTKYWICARLFFRARTSAISWLFSA